MNDLPRIEWPEQHDSLEEIRVVEMSIGLLESEIQKCFNTKNCFYLISPHPAYNIEPLIEVLTSTEAWQQSHDKWHPLLYGYKNRGWGLIFNKMKSLNFILPIFFLHGSENLVIAAIEKSSKIQEDDFRLSELAKKIVLGAEGGLSEESYVGLMFDCGCLMKVFKSLA